MKPFSYRPLAAAIGISVAFSLSAQAENNVPYDAGATAGGLSGAFAIQIKTEAGKTKFETANVDFKSLIVDDQGRISYIIDFEDNATLPYLKGPEPSDNLPDWHKPEMRRFIAAFSQYYGFEVSGLTSWLGSSAAAFLNEDQLNAVLQDPRVKRVTPNSRIELPQPPLVERTNEASDLEFLPQANQFAGDNAFAIAPIGWNIAYMGGSQVAPGNSTTIYIVDTGVGKHDNLPTSMVRVNPQLPSGNGVLSLTGCPPHSAHVAGIIAGLGLQGVSGLYRGAPVVSVSIYKNSANSGDCVAGPASAETLTRAFDYVFQEITKKQKMGVVTMSVNLVANQESVYESLRKLVKPNPATNYKGAVFVQSAGNRSSDDPNKKDTKSACEASFNDRNNDDGVIIVGAIDSNGQPAVPLNGINGLRNMRTNVIPNAYPGFFIAAADERGTRYDPPGEGQCVDIWAPGKEIYSTWGDTDDNNNGYRQSEKGPLSLSKRYAYLSGTSMAAPHIAALAAHTIDYYGLTTPSQVEQKIRSMRVNTGQPVYNRNGYDFNQPIYVARFFGGTPPLSKPTIEFAFKNTMAHEVVSGFVADDSANIINSTIKIYNTRDIFLYYDSVGAKSCTVTRYLNNISQGIVTNSLVSSQLVSGLLPIGTHRWDASCTASNGQVSTASASAIVEAVAPLPTPQVTWTINGQAVSGSVGKTTSDSFTLAYSSINANNCNVQGETSSNGSNFVPWDSRSNTGVSYNWGTMQLAAGWYRWTAICTGNGGTTSQLLTMLVAGSTCSDTVSIYSLQYVGPSGHDTYLTTSGSEYNNARAVGYTPVGIIARLPRTQVANTTQFRRFYNATRHNHIATYSSTEIPYLLANGWGNDGIVGYIYTSQQSGTMPLYRLWKDHTGRDDTEHRYTVNWSDVPSLVQQGWGYDGVYGYVCP